MNHDFIQSSQGQFVFARIEELSIMVVGDRIGEDEWQEGLEAAVVACLGQRVLATLTHSANITLNARQRRVSTEVLQKHGALPAECVALITGSQLVRGAATAFSWITPRAFKLRAFSPLDSEGALTWLRQHAAFDLSVARTSLAEMVASVAMVKEKSG